MTYLTDEYARTFHPIVLHTFDRERKRSAEQLKFARTHGFDEWCRVYGPHIFQKKYRAENIILEIRGFDETNGTSLRYLIERCTPEAFKAFATQYGAEDIVNVLGESIMTKSRREISECGHEFFFVRKKKTKRIVMRSEHHMDRDDIVAKFAKKFFRKLITFISKNAASIKTKTDIEEFFSNLDGVVSIILKDALTKTQVKVRSEGLKKYKIDDILRIISSQEGGVPGKMDFETFLLKIKSGIGNEIKNWYRGLPAIWKSIQNKLDSDDNISLDKNKRGLNRKEVRLFKSSIGSYLSPKKPTYEDHLVGMYNGTVRYKRKQVPVQVPSVKKKASRQDLFDNVNISCDCNYCNKPGCDSQTPRIGGSIAEYKNPSGICSEQLFRSYEFGEKLKKIQAGVSKKNSKTDEPVVVLLLQRGESFDKGKHIFSMKKIKKIEDESDLETKVKLKSVKGHKYDIIGNKLTQSGASVVEYMDPEVPSVLFLLEERDD